MRSLTRSWLFLPLLERLVLLAFAFLLGIYLRSPWIPPLPLHAPAVILLSFPKVRLSPTLTISLLMIWYSGQTALVLFAFGKGDSGVLVNCFLCGTEATLSYSAGPICLSFSAKACTILHALCWSRQHQ